MDEPTEVASEVKEPSEAVEATEVAPEVKEPSEAVTQEESTDTPNTKPEMQVKIKINQRIHVLQN